jgi:hypothetical protein
MIKKYLLISICILNSINGFSQSTDSLAVKITDKMCNCLGDFTDYKTYKSRFDNCYDSAISQVISEKNMSEIMLLLNPDKKQEVNKKIETLIRINCESVNHMFNKELSSSVETSSNSGVNAFPTNFTDKDIKKPDKWNGKIVAFEGEIKRLEKSTKNTPYYELKLNINSIWIISMIDSGFEKVGNKIRVVGYLLDIDKSDNDNERQFHNDDYHVLVFGVVDLMTKQLAYYPGSEMQMKQWINGQIPSSGK